MLLALFTDNDIAAPKEILEKGISATVFLMGDHASRFDSTVARRNVLNRFLKRVDKVNPDEL